MRLGNVGSLDAPPGSREWAVAVRLDIQTTLNDVKGDAEHLDTMIGLVRKHEGYRQLTSRQGRVFESYEAFCVDPQPFGLGYRIADIDRIIGERKEQSVKDLAAKTVPLREGPGAPKGSQNNPSGKTKELIPETPDAGPLFLNANWTNSPISWPKRPGPDTQGRLTARIARDRPDILDRMKAGLETLLVEVRKGTREDALWDAAGSNREHDASGMRRTNADKQRAVRMALVARPGKGDREIAKQVGVHHETVGVARKTICRIPTDTREVTRNGTTYTMQTGGIGPTSLGDIRPSAWLDRHGGSRSRVGACK